MSKPLLVIGSKNLSSWSLRPWLALKFAGVDFDERVVLFDRPNTSDELKRHSPTAKVPVLVHEGQTLWESLAICEYVAEVFAPQLWPHDRAARAHARCISHEMHAGFASLRQTCPMNLKLTPSGETINPQAGADMLRIAQLWKKTRDRYGAGGPFLFGASPTIADAMYAPVVTRIVSYGIPVHAAVDSYVDAIAALPAMREWKSAALLEP